MCALIQSNLIAIEVLPFVGMVFTCVYASFPVCTYTPCGKDNVLVIYLGLSNHKTLCFNEFWVYMWNTYINIKKKLISLLKLGIDILWVREVFWQSIICNIILNMWVWANVFSDLFTVYCLLRLSTYL